MASPANRLFFLTGKFEVERLLVLNFIAKIAPEFQNKDARRLKIQVFFSLK
jgi:hypothetical protein